MTSFRLLLKNGFWLTLSTLASKVVSMASLPVLARLLGPQSLGVYAVYFSAVQAGQAVSTFGSEAALQRVGAREVASGGKELGGYFGAGLLLSTAGACLVGFCLWFWRETFAASVYGNVGLTPWMGVAAVAVALFPLSMIPLLLLAACQEFRAYALRTSGMALLAGVLTVAGAYHFGLPGAILALCAAEIIQIPYTWLLLKSWTRAYEVRLNFRHAWRHAKDLLRVGVPYFLGNTLAGAVGGVIMLGLVSKYQGLAQLGNLRVAQCAASIIATIPAAIAPAALSSLSAASVLGTAAYVQGRATHLKFIWLLVALPTVATVPLLPTLIRLAFGSTYEQAVWPGAFLLWITVLSCLGSCLVQYHLVQGQTTRVCMSSSLGTGSWVAASYLLIPSMGLLGLLLGQLVGQVVGLLFLLRTGLQDTDRAELRRFGWMALLTALMASADVLWLQANFRFWVCLQGAFLLAAGSGWLAYRLVLSVQDRQRLRSFSAGKLGRNPAGIRLLTLLGWKSAPTP